MREGSFVNALLPQGWMGAKHFCTSYLVFCTGFAPPSAINPRKARLIKANPQNHGELSASGLLLIPK